MAGQEEGRGWVGWESSRVPVGVGGWNGVKWCGAGQDGEQSDQGLHCLPFCLHRLDSLLYGRAT